MNPRKRQNLTDSKFETLQRNIHFQKEVQGTQKNEKIKCGYVFCPVDELDELLLDNRKVMLRSIAEDLRTCLPLDAIFPTEVAAKQKVSH